MPIRRLKIGIVILLLAGVALSPWIHAIDANSCVRSSEKTCNVATLCVTDSQGFNDLVVKDDSDNHTALSSLEVVTVYAVADEEYRSRFFGRWRTKMIADIGRAGLRFLLFTGTSIVVRSVGTWESNDACHDAHELIDEVRWEVDKGGCDVVVAFTGQHLNDNIAGVAECPGDDVLCSTISNVFIDNLIQHEMSHLFGCRDHVPGWGTPCVMSYAYFRFAGWWCPTCLHTIRGK